MRMYYGRMDDRWTMYFDGVVNISGNKVKTIIISLEKKWYLVSMKLQFECTIKAEYKASIINFEAALELDVKKLDVYGDSMLIIF